MKRPAASLRVPEPASRRSKKRPSAASSAASSTSTAVQPAAAETTTTAETTTAAQPLADDTDDADVQPAAAETTAAAETMAAETTAWGGPQGHQLPAVTLVLPTAVQAMQAMQAFRAPRQLLPIGPASVIRSDGSIVNFPNMRMPPDRSFRTFELEGRLPAKLTRTGVTKKMAITRQVVDKKNGVQKCQACDGRGVTVQVVRMGPMIQQMQSACGACGGQGKSFKSKSEREVLEVVVQKGATDNHKVVFREKADEHPDADTGDVNFMLKEQPHDIFKRKGADLYIERDISLVEALCGFQMELVHLDGRKLIIKTSPGEIVKPMARGFNPLDDGESAKTEWETFEDCDCPGVENVARAETNDIDVLKDACEKQLKRKGIEVGTFVVDGRGASFKQCTREEAMAGKRPAKGKTMYVISDPNSKKGLRMMKAVKDEGMPTLKNPFIHGNLFLILTIKFPDTLSAENQAAIKAILPGPENAPKPGAAEDPSYEVHFVSDIDPVQSFEANKVHMKDTDNAYDDDDEPQGRGGGPGGAQCQQQ